MERYRFRDYPRWVFWSLEAASRDTAIPTKTHFSDFPPIDKAHVVVLTNYLRKHHALVFQEIRKHVGKLTVLLSTAMEPDRDWDPQWGDLDVQVQKNWMYTARWKHTSGFDEPNYIHIPIDTVSKLRGLKPDIVFSYEMGMRTAFSGLFRMLHRKVPLVMVGNMADHIESERGMARRAIRRFVRGRVDYATYNGPSCKRYLEQIGFTQDQLFHFPYCIDMEKTYKGPQTFDHELHRHLIYTGAISSRKGILPFIESVSSYLDSNPSRKVTLSIAGDGPLKEEVEQLRTDQLAINLLGNCDPDEVSAAYQSADICVFPTLGDEWGLVPIEAMASGLPVLGSTRAQSVEAVVTDDVNGWRFEPLSEASMNDAIARALQTSNEKLREMSDAARLSIADLTPQVSAAKFCNLIRVISGQTDKTSHAERENTVTDATAPDGEISEKAAGDAASATENVAS